MGSFNTTCFASQQTISEREKARIIFVQQQRTYEPVEFTGGKAPAKAFGFANSNCHVDSFWRPLGTFIEAVYADYGQFTLSLNPASRRAWAHTLATLLEKSLKVAQGENKSHDVPFDLQAKIETYSAEFQKTVGPRSFNAADPVFETDVLDAEFEKALEYVWTAVNENRLFGPDYSGAIRPITVSVISEPAYQAAIKLIEESKTYDDQPLDIRSNLLRRYSYLRKTMRELKLPEDKTPQDKERTRLWREESAIRESVEGVMTQLSAATRTNYRLVLDLLPDYKDTFPEDDAEVVDRILSRPGLMQMLMDAYAMGGLDSLNLRFSPMVYAGQDYSNALGKSYAKFVQDVSVKVTRSSIERSYGEFKPMTFWTATDFDAAQVEKDVRHHDFALFVLEKTELPKGFLENRPELETAFLVKVEVTLDSFAELKEYAPDSLAAVLADAEVIL